jgi:3-oxoacyl-[acyl-carrier protein] reductase
MGTGQEHGMGRLDGRVAIVTGAGGGIGREHALLLAREGASVVVNDIGLRAGADASATVAEIATRGGRAVTSTASATWEGASEIVEAAIAAFGRIDILVNNATAGGNEDLWRFTEAEWDKTFAVNLKGYFAMIRAVTPHLARQRAGAIVNTSSGSGFGHPSHVAYASAKEGVVGLTRTAAKELGRFGVRCNAIRPLAASFAVTEYHEQTARWRRLMDLTMGASTTVTDPKDIDPSMVAPFVVWLCTDAARGVNGKTFFVSGGTVALLTEPKPQRTIHHDGGWTLDDLDAAAPAELVNGLVNRFTLDDAPDLQVFPAAEPDDPPGGDPSR